MAKLLIRLFIYDESIQLDKLPEKEKNRYWDAYTSKELKKRLWAKCFVFNDSDWMYNGEEEKLIIKNDKGMQKEFIVKDFVISNLNDLFITQKIEKNTEKKIEKIW